jgi:hypothetical protein
MSTVQVKRNKKSYGKTQLAFSYSFVNFQNFFLFSLDISLRFKKLRFQVINLRQKGAYLTNLMGRSITIRNIGISFQEQLTWHIDRRGHLSCLCTVGEARSGKLSSIDYKLT